MNPVGDFNVAQTRLLERFGMTPMALLRSAALSAPSTFCRSALDRRCSSSRGSAVPPPCGRRSWVSFDG